MKRFIDTLFLVLIAGSLMAVPARKGGFMREAPDGTMLRVYQYGDEDFHYLTDSEGRWLDETTLLPLTEEQKSARIETGKTRHIRRVKQQMEGVGGKPNPAPRGLLILANFTDSKFQTPVDTIDTMHNGSVFTRKYQYDYDYTDSQGIPRHIHEEVDSHGSARQYFFDQSFGQYNPQFDIIGPVELSNNTAYYGSNNSQGNDKNVTGMIKEACQKADEAGANFALYDNDNDGYVDFVYVIYAGFGEADGGPAYTIWPHQYNISGLKLDGKNISRYACGSEMSFWSKLYAGIGTFCHEFSHVLGLPDMYMTENQNVKPHTLYQWDILDTGCYNGDGNTPPAYSSYERFYMGWLEPRILTEPEYVTLPNINEGTGSSLLISATDTHNMVGWNPNPTEFYMLEARSKQGWDADLPGEGLLITHITYNSSTWTGNSVNNNYKAMGVDIIEAQKNTESKAKPTDAFPVGATEWTDFANHELTNISFDNRTGEVHFSYRGAEIPTNLESVTPKEGRGKILRDGKVIIIRENKEYNVLGQQL